jgi:hypothetical protein
MKYKERLRGVLDFGDRCLEDCKSWNWEWDGMVDTEFVLLDE